MLLRMSAAVAEKPGPNRADATAVLRQLREAGHVAYFAGGCVRDLLLGQEPKDFDVATDAPPDRVRELFRNTQAVGAAFGVILVRQGRSMIEVATFRADLEYRDGRRPEGVRFTTAEEDARRRDFTINGLFLDPLEDRVIDYVGGQADLKAKVLRAIGNAAERFAEDHLRLLRAVRFASRLEFQIESSTATAIATHARELQRISPERVADELRRMLTPATRDQAFALLRQFRLLDVLMRFLPERMTAWPEETFSLFLALGPPTNHGAISFGLALAALMLCFRMHATGQYNLSHWLSEAEIRRSRKAMRQALKISNDEEEAMSGALAFGHLLPPAAPSVAMLKRFLARRASNDARLLMAAMARCGLMKDELTALMIALAELEKTDFAPPPLITGDDLAATGATPGPVFKQALSAAYDAQLENRVTTRQAALELAMGIIRSSMSC